MLRVVDYAIVRADTLKDLEREVMIHIRSGWDVAGGVLAYTDVSLNAPAFAQAMTKAEYARPVTSTR